MATSNDLDRVREAALRIIDRRAVPKGRLRERLVRRGFNEADVDATLDALERVGVLSDRAIAVDVAERLLDREPIGPDALRRRLLHKGLQSETVAEVVGEIYSGRDASADIEQAARRLAGRQRSDLPPEVAVRRLVAALVRRGFDQESSVLTAERIISLQPDGSAQ